ncbi:dihydropteroate synthase [Thalassotalea agarivorans]|nr:dihydropteroate synthase [Thalassotalea agarivorans]
MGILNVTPDSFSDGGAFNQLDNAIDQVADMIEHGADMIDVGGESTRPGAAEVSLDQELSRVVPIIEAINDRFDVAISLDTSKAEVMAAGIERNVAMINDVRALQLPGALEAVANSNVQVCLMHMQGQPKTMQDNPNYEDVVNDINSFFEARINACEQAGIAKQRIILDPGFGFGKTLAQNYHILAHFQAFKHFELPLLAGISRKSMLGNLLNRPVQDRLASSISAAVIACQHGADYVRVHDVKETVDALKVWRAVNQFSGKEQ